MFASMVIITKKEVLTEEEIDKALFPYSYDAEVPEHEYGSIESFRHYLGYCKDELQMFGVEEFKRLYPRVSIETIENDDLVRYIEENWAGDYRVKGDTVYSIKNDKDCLFDFWNYIETFNSMFLYTKDGKKVYSCKTTDWDIVGKGVCLPCLIEKDDKIVESEYEVEMMQYDMLYDYENDKMMGNPFRFKDDEIEEWGRKFIELVTPFIGEDTYAHIIKCHF